MSEEEIAQMKKENETLKAENASLKATVTERDAKIGSLTEEVNGFLSKGGALPEGTTAQDAFAKLFGKNN